MSKKVMAVDIGSSSIKLIFADDSGRVSDRLILANPVAKNISLMTNSEKMVLVDLIKNKMAEVGIKVSGIYSAVPESLVYSRVMKFPRMSTPELATAIKWELDQNVPFPPNEIEMSWSVMDSLMASNKSSEEVVAYVVAVPSKISEGYVQIFDLLELEIQKLENESVSLHRAMSPYVPEGGLCLAVDFGASGTNILLLTKEAIANSYYYSVGGSAFTKLISESFGLPLDQAESYKRTYGLLPDQLDGKVFKVLKPVVDNLVLELKKMVISYKNDYGDYGSLRLVLTGGGCYMVGLIPYISAALDGVEVVVANVFEGMNMDPADAALGPVFSVSYGLAKGYGN